MIAGLGKFAAAFVQIEERAGTPVLMKRICDFVVTKIKFYLLKCFFKHYNPLMSIQLQNCESVFVVEC